MSVALFSLIWAICVKYKVLLIAFAIGLTLIYAVNYWESLKVEAECPSDLLMSVNPVPATFNWETAKPEQYRPFKPVYHMTMGLKTLTHDDWLQIENSYLINREIHKQVMLGHPENVCTANSSSNTKAAVKDLYEYALETIRKRYPMYFSVSGDEKGSLQNKITGKSLPWGRTVSNYSAKELLQILSLNFEEDFLVMEFDEARQEYMLRAATGIMANGFSFSDKMDLKLTDIHEPVPNYVPKLKGSMNRYFNKIQPGQFVQRLTWGIQLSSKYDLHKPAGNHMSKGQTISTTGVPDPTNLDFRNGVFMRLERQVLTKLPRSNFIMLSVRTYMYSLEDIKKEGLATAMADNICAWPEDTAHYKSRTRWGAAVLSYLRSES